MEREMKKDHRAHSHAHVEVEKKFAISEMEFLALLAKAKRLGFRIERAAVITDTLLQHTGDLTRRIRRLQIVSEKAVVVFERTQKTRRQGIKGKLEEEETISAAEAEADIAEAVYRAASPLPAYSKLRFEHAEEDRLPSRWRLLSRFGVKIVLDLAEGLGPYSGHYIEIECLVPLKHENKISKVEEKIVRFARFLLGDERKPSMSYARMLLASREIARKSQCA
jgi:hypothetical protein